MSVRNWRLQATFVCLIAMVSCGDQSEPGVSPDTKPRSSPNVLLITIGTLRTSHLSTYGYATNTSPNISRLAAQGVRFTAAYAPMPSTAPSHATMMTGLYPVEHGVTLNSIPLAERHMTLAEHLKKMGYQTHAVVSSYILNRKFGFAQGFDSYDDVFPIDGSTVRSASVSNTGFDQQANIATDKALEVVAKASHTKDPFFLFVHYMDPHSPYVPAKSFLRPLDNIEDTKPLHIRHAIRKYNGEIEYTDQEVGRLLDSLDSLELRENTLIILTSDHGELLWDDGEELMGHGFTLHESEVRIPLVFSWKGRMEQGRTIQSSVGLTDLLPTILDVVEADQGPVRLDGVSLHAGLLKGEKVAPDRAIFLHRQNYDGGENERGYAKFRNPPGRAIRKQGVKYGVRIGDMKFTQGGQDGKDQLYDLATDSEERDNLADRYAEKVGVMEGAITDWLLDHSATSDTSTPPTPNTDIDEEALRALGYIE